MVLAAAIERAERIDGGMRIYLDQMNRYAVKLLHELGGGRLRGRPPAP
jgi:hypothetical protein